MHEWTEVRMKLQINNDPHLLSKGAIYGRFDEKKTEPVDLSRWYIWIPLYDAKFLFPTVQNNESLNQDRISNDIQFRQSEPQIVKA